MTCEEADSKPRTLSEITTEAIHRGVRDALKRHDGDIDKAANELAVNPNYVRQIAETINYFKRTPR